MAIESDKIRIQAALVTLGRAGPYYQIAYDTATGLSVVLDLSTAPTITPGTVMANETSSRTVPDVRWKRDRRRTLASWAWELIVAFDIGEALVTQAEEAWRNSPLMLPADPSKGLSQAFFEYEGASYYHPVRTQAESGTAVKFQFAVELHAGRN